MDFENKEAIHNTRIAPTVEVIKLPINPEAASPKRANTQPPNTPPRIPSNKFITRPKPPPRIILPARNPATIPIIINDYPHNSPNYKIARKTQSCKGKVLENARHS